MAKKQAVRVGPQSDPEDRRQQELYWREVLREQSGSGLNQSEFCRQQSIPMHRLVWWKREIAARDGKRSRPERKKASRKGPTRATSSLVPVKISSSGTSSREVSPEAPFEIVFKNKWTLRIPQEFDAAAVGRLLRLVKESC